MLKLCYVKITKESNSMHECSYKKNPKELLVLWFAIEDMIFLFMKGGLPCVSAEDVSKEFKHNRDSTCICKNITMSTCYCSLATNAKKNLTVIAHCS